MVVELFNTMLFSATTIGLSSLSFSWAEGIRLLYICYIFFVNDAIIFCHNDWLWVF